MRVERAVGGVEEPERRASSSVRSIQAIASALMAARDRSGIGDGVGGGGVRDGLVYVDDGDVPRVEREIDRAGEVGVGVNERDAPRGGASRRGGAEGERDGKERDYEARPAPRRTSPKRLAQRSRILGIGTTREATKVLLEESRGICPCAPIGLKATRGVKSVLRPGVRAPRELGVDAQGVGRVASLESGRRLRIGTGRMASLQREERERRRTWAQERRRGPGPRAGPGGSRRAAESDGRHVPPPCLRSGGAGECGCASGALARWGWRPTERPVAAVRGGSDLRVRKRSAGLVVARARRLAAAPRRRSPWASEARPAPPSSRRPVLARPQQRQLAMLAHFDDSMAHRHRRAHSHSPHGELRPYDADLNVAGLDEERAILFARRHVEGDLAALEREHRRVFFFAHDDA